MKIIDWTHLQPKFAGNWVAFAKDGQTVIARAKTLKALLSTASKQGHSNPVTFKVPQTALLYVGQNTA